MAGREPDGLINQEHRTQSSIDVPLAGNKHLTSLHLNRDAAGCSECAAAKANAFKAGMALVAHMDELQKVQKKLKEKEDLLKVYSARDKYIDEILTKNEQLSDDLSKIRIANTELKDKIKRQEERIAELLQYEGTHQEALAFKKKNAVLKETLQKSEEQRRIMNKKYQDSVLFAQERVEHLVNEVKEANEQIAKWKNQVSKVPRIQEARQLISDLVQVLVTNNLSGEGLLKRCERFIDIDCNTKRNDFSKRIRAISNRSLSTTSDDDDARELENLMQYEEPKSERTDSSAKQSRDDLSVPSTSSVHTVETAVKSPQEFTKLALIDEADSNKHKNANFSTKKEAASFNKNKHLKSKCYAMDAIEEVHSKFLTRKVSQGVNSTVSNDDNINSSIIGKKTKTIKEQQLEMIARHKKQKLVEASLKKTSAVKEEKLNQVCSEKSTNKMEWKNGEPSSNFLDDFVLSDSDDELESSASIVVSNNSTEAVNEKETNGIKDEVMKRDITKNAVIKTIIVDDEQASDTSYESFSDLEGELVETTVEKQATKLSLGDLEQVKNPQLQLPLKRASTSRSEEIAASSEGSELAASKKSESNIHSAVGISEDNGIANATAVISVAESEVNQVEKGSLNSATSADSIVEESNALQGVDTLSKKNAELLTLNQRSLIEDEITKKKDTDGVELQKNSDIDGLLSSVSDSAGSEESCELFESQLHMKKSLCGIVRVEGSLNNSEDSGKRKTHVGPNTHTPKIEKITTNNEGSSSGGDDELAIINLVVNNMLNSLSIPEARNKDIATTSSSSGTVDKCGEVSNVSKNAAKTNLKDRREEQCFCIRKLLSECAFFLLGPDGFLDSYVPKPKRRKIQGKVKCHSVDASSDSIKNANDTVTLTASRPLEPKSNLSTPGNEALQKLCQRNVSYSTESGSMSPSSKHFLIERPLSPTVQSVKLIKRKQLSPAASTSKPPLTEEESLSPAVRSAKSSVKRKQLSPAVSTSKPPLTEEESLSPALRSAKSSVKRKQLSPAVSTSKPPLTEEESLSPAVRSAKPSVKRKQLSPAVSTSKPLLTEEESLSSDSSSSLLIADEPLSPEVPLPNVDYAPVVQESSSNSVINSAKEIVLSEDQEADKAISKPETGNVLVTSTTELYLDNAGDKNYPKKLAKKKPIKPLKDILKTTEDLSLHGSKFIGTSIIGKKVAFHENLSAEVHDKVNQRLLLPLSRNAKNQRIAVSKGNQVTAAKRRHSGESVSTGAQKMQKICEPNPSVIEPPMVKKRKEVANVQARYEIKNSETAVLSFLDDLLVKKCRLEDILLKFRDLATSQSLSTTELSSCLVKYVNNANIGKVPWSSLIGLIQKGRSLQGNLVELINQLSAESQWTTLGIEFCRKLCLSFLRSNQLLNASRHLNIACCLILISRALSMDSELSEEIDYNEIKTLLLGILKYSICNHPSEWVVPMLCLAQKFVPHLVKDLYCKCGISSDRGFVCELISVHLAAKHDYFSKFMSFWHETETEDPVDVKKIDAAEFNKMLIVRKDDVLSTRNGVNIEKQVVNPHMQFMISSYISLFLIADPLLFPDKIDYTLKLLSQTLSALTNNEETLYAVNVNSAKEKNINSLLLCAYLLRGIRGMYRLNVDSIARLKKLAFDAYELYQDIHTRSQEQVISNEEQCLQFAVEQLFFALQI